ncbi:hypothetical protein M1N89_02400 [Dehalococcoidia bacterium]|nr:hypothetical protein [Dehalococcoidia bacterium]
MAKSQVYFIGPRTGTGRDMFVKLEKLLDRAGLPNFIQQNELVAIMPVALRPQLLSPRALCEGLPL